VDWLECLQQGLVVWLVGAQCGWQWWLGPGKAQGSMWAGGDLVHPEVDSRLTRHGRVLGGRDWFVSLGEKSAVNLPLERIHVDWRGVRV